MVYLCFLVLLAMPFCQLASAYIPPKMRQDSDQAPVVTSAEVNEHTGSPMVTTSAPVAPAKETMVTNNDMIEPIMDETNVNTAMLDEQLRRSRMGPPGHGPGHFFMQGFLNFVIPVSVVFLIVILFHYYVCKNFTPQHREIMKQRLREITMEGWGIKEKPSDADVPKEDPKP